MKILIKKIVCVSMLIGAFFGWSSQASAALITQNIFFNGADIGELQYDHAIASITSGTLFTSEDPMLSLEFTINGIFQDETFDNFFAFGFPSFSFDIADLAKGVVGISFESSDFSIFSTDVLDNNFNFLGSLSFGTPENSVAVQEPYGIVIFILGVTLLLLTPKRKKLQYQ